MRPKQLIRLNMYYAMTAIRDSWRSRTTLFTNAVIFAGICLFILLLIGLKRGLVEKFRTDILKSPTATEIKWWATRPDLALDEHSERLFIHQFPGHPVIIPEITKIVKLSLDGGPTVENVTLQATVPNDPYLSFHGIGITEPESRSLIISPAVAKELGIESVESTEGECTVQITVSRQDTDETVTASLHASITAVVGSDDSKAKSGYLSRFLMDRIEDFSQGESVAELGWPGRKSMDTIGYQGYLAFTKRPYTYDDTNRLHLRGMKATKVDQLVEGVSPLWSRLGGLLSKHDLHVYYITSEMGSTASRQFLDFDVAEVEDITGADDVMLYWSAPIEATINQQSHAVIGVSGSMRWLRSYFKSPATNLGRGDMFRVMLPHSAASISTATLNISSDQVVTLSCLQPSTEIEGLGQFSIVEAIDACIHQLSSWRTSLPELASKVVSFNLNDGWQECRVRKFLADAQNQINKDHMPLAIVPAELLAAIHKQRGGSMAFDSMTRQFTRTRQPNTYFNGRIYANVLEDIPVLDERLRQMGYSTISSRLRVQEMQGYAGTLDLLVNILQLVAVVLGVVTVSVVFMEVTRRRQTSIGIMRIMGMEPMGIFLFVFIRALMIAVVGWIFATAFAVAATYLMPIACQAECLFLPGDFAQVLAGALACSSLGVLFHAWYAATRLDPVDAISGGKVQ